MDTAKLEGIISAIETESKIPSPSHANLARLVSNLFRVLVEEFSKPVCSTVITDAPTVTDSNPGTTYNETIEPPPPPKKRKKSK